MNRKDLLRLFKDSAPFGQAFLMVLIVTLVMTIVALQSAPTIAHYTIHLQEQGDSVRERDDPTEWFERNGETLGCLSTPSLTPSSEGLWLLDCSLDADLLLAPLLDALPEGLEDLGWEVSTSADTSAAQTGWSIFVILLIPAAVAAWILRTTDLATDWRNSIRFLRRRAWALIAVPAAGMGIYMTFATLLPVQQLPASLMPMEWFLPTTLLYVIVIGPLLEEALFREWAYRRTIDKLGVWICALGTSWFFMLAHLFNPQIEYSPGYLPTIFCLGLLLFWVRHRSQSILLTIVCHGLYNALALLAAGLLALPQVTQAGASV